MKETKEYKIQKEFAQQIRIAISDWCYRQKSHPTPADIDLILKRLLATRRTGDKP